ncbi:unnamed protein product [Protopolystoma xenopodis]|uniref:Poly(A) polymerase RNA-binding domain-containing protein n=1 Tax=Protopolystoma xenopodis TaxID=117903 RepID=A0A3S5CEH1_9PLAT|nr:unnamed protein product [Protopolystoma xenopodis]
MNLCLSIVRDVMLRKRTWAELFEYAFFFTYKHYVVVIVIGRSLSSFTGLCGLVESKLRVLVGNFEQNRYVKMAHINCRAYGPGPNDELPQPDGGEDTENIRKLSQF